MSGKSAIKDEVWHQQFADCVLAADKSELDGRTNGIPRLAGSAANSGALQTIMAAIDDTGVRMHGLSYTPGMFGDSLVDAVLAPAQRFFREYPHGETYVMRMDIGPFMPQPKRASGSVTCGAPSVPAMQSQAIPPKELPTTRSNQQRRRGTR